MTAYFEKLGQEAAEGIFKEFGKLLSPDPTATDPEAAKAPEEGVEEDLVYALDEAVRVLQKAEDAVETGNLDTIHGYLSVADRYITIASVALEYDL